MYVYSYIWVYAFFMAQDTRHLLAGMFLSLVIVAGVSVGARLLQTQAAMASEPSVFLACVK